MCWYTFLPHYITSNSCCSYDLNDDSTKDSYHLQFWIDRHLRALGKIQRANQITRMLNSIISLDNGNSSDRDFNCEAKISREHF